MSLNGPLYQREDISDFYKRLTPRRGLETTCVEEVRKYDVGEYWRSWCEYASRFSQREEDKTGCEPDQGRDKLSQLSRGVVLSGDLPVCFADKAHAKLRT